MTVWETGEGRDVFCTAVHKVGGTPRLPEFSLAPRFTCRAEGRRTVADRRWR
jgi:hypothetical protein